MKKTLVALLAALLAFTSLFLFTGCDDDEDDDAGTSVKLSYYLSEDASHTTDVYVSDAASFVLEVPSRTGYKFLGLFDASDGGTQIIDENGKSNVSIERDMTLHAQWEACSYTFAFDAAEGSVVGSDTEKEYVYDSSISIFPLAEREGYDFLGWSIGEQIYSDSQGRPLSSFDSFNFTNYPRGADGKIHLSAKWERRQLTVTFDYNDGSYQSQSVKVYYGDSLYPTDFPMVDTGSKETKGWAHANNTASVITTPLTDIKEDISLYAIWRSYKVVQFVETDSKTENVKVYSDDTYSPYIPERKGYDFDGWYESRTFSGNPAGAVYYYNAKDTYYAKWNMVTYTVNFSVEGEYDGDTSSKTYNVETDLLLPTVTKEKYTFIGWCRNEDLSDKPMTLIEAGNSGNITLYAKFKGDDRQVTLDAGVGMLSSGTAILEYGAINTLPIPTVSDHAFNGWYLEDGTQLTDRDGVTLEKYMFDEPQSLTAKYTKKYYITVDIPYPAGTVELREHYVEGESVILKFDHTDPGYVFGGFYEGSTLLTDIKTHGFYMPASDVHLKIMLTPAEYELTFNTNGGYDTVAGVKVYYNKGYTLPIAYKPGFVFTGWKLDGEFITDKNGKSIAPWTMPSDATVKAEFAPDTNGETVYYITTVEEFMAIANDPTAKYVIVRDLDFSGSGFTTIAELSGTLDGNGRKIIGVSCPLFGSISGTARNLDITATVTAAPEAKPLGILANSISGSASLFGITTRGSIVISGAYDIGGVIGTMSDNSTVVSCVNYANVSLAQGTAEDGSVGGIVAWIVGGTLSDCKNYGNISGQLNVGGVAGGVSSSGVISECANYGAVAGGKRTGGVLGTIDIGKRSVSISDLSNSAAISGTDYVGGIIGYVSSSLDSGKSNATYTVTLTDVENSGKITGTNYIGGICGYYYTDYTCKSGYTAWCKLEATGISNSADIIGASYVGGLYGFVHTDNGDSFIDSSSSSGTLTADYYIGGIAARIESVTLRKCSNKGTAISAQGALVSEDNYHAFIGGYAGYGYIFEDCANDVTINYSQGGMYIGGIVGYTTGNLINCSNTADICAPKASHVGGIAGYAGYGNVNIAYEKLNNSGDVTGLDRVGGIIGTVYSYASIGKNNGTYTVQMNTLENSGDIVGNDYVAGITGHFHIQIDTNSGSYTGWSKLIATATQNSGDVTGNAYVGGLFGYASTDNGDSKIIEASSSGHVKASYFIGGIAGQLNAIQLENCSNNGASIEATGYLIEGTSYYAYIGGYVGHGGTVNGAVNESEIVYNNQGLYVGGIAGYTTGNLIDCSNTARVYAPKASHVGGIAGYAGYGNTNITYDKLYNSGDVTGLDRVGGIIGTVYSYASIGKNNGTYTVQMTKINNSGSISGNDYVAGITGHLLIQVDTYSGSYTGWSKLIATAPENSGDVTGNAYVGGLFGYASTDNGDSKIIEASSSGQVKASYFIGGLAGQLDAIQLENCSNSGTTIEATGYLIDGTSYYAYVGGYVGRGGVVNGAVNAADILYAERGVYVGGIAGYTTGNLINCSNSAEICAPKASHVGGIAGYAEYGNTNVTYEGLNNSGDITGLDRVGGIIGTVYGHANIGKSNQTYTVQITTTENLGSITGNDYVAGIIGHLNVSIDVYSSSYTGWTQLIATAPENSGDVTGNAYVGGLFGYASTDNGDSKILNAASSGNIKAAYYVGGLAGQLDAIQLENCSNSGASIEATGYLIDGTNYYAYVGGYVGYGGTVNGAVNAADILYEERGMYVGGIIGYTAGNLIDCSNSARIYAPKASYAGGIAGYAGYGNASIKYETLENSGDVTGANYVGGIIGHVNSYAYIGKSNNTYTFAIKYVENSGAINGGDYVGGLFGYMKLQIDVYSSSYNGWANVSGNILENSGAITGNDRVGGLFGYFYSDGESVVIDYTAVGTATATADGGLSSSVAAEATNITFEE